jgi:hypothetical protein
MLNLSNDTRKAASARLDSAQLASLEPPPFQVGKASLDGGENRSGVPTYRETYRHAQKYVQNFREIERRYNQGSISRQTSHGRHKASNLRVERYFKNVGSHEGTALFTAFSSGRGQRSDVSRLTLEQAMNAHLDIAQRTARGQLSSGEASHEHWGVIAGLRKSGYPQREVQFHYDNLKNSLAITREKAFCELAEQLLKSEPRR